MEHLGTKTIETKRLILRRFEINDAKAMFHNWANDDEVTRFLTWPSHKSIEVSQAVLGEWINNYAADDFYQWAIVLKSNGDEPIGGISVVLHRDDIKMVHIGYCIGRKWWCNGIVSEALMALIEFFFKEVGINRVEARFDPINVASGKVMQKCGMKYEGTVRQGDLNNTGICDYSMYGIVASDFSHKLPDF